MKLVMVIYAGDTPALVTDLFDACEVGGYTQLPTVRGVGTTGRREGTRAWPGASTVFLSVMQPDCAAEFMRRIRERALALPPEERLHAAVVPVESFN